jgi:hypothetical protein
MILFASMLGAESSEGPAISQHLSFGGESQTFPETIGDSIARRRIAINPGPESLTTFGLT